MSLVNLPENFLYQRLPAGLIELDERALIQAVVGGYQDRLEDLRAYGKKFQLFFSPVGLPETGPNVVLVDFTTSQGKVVTRSLDLTSDTPANSAQLLEWCAAQLGVDTLYLANARFGLDLLRLVDANILDYLATNIGAVLYKSAVAEQQPITISDSGTFTAQQLANQRLIETYFPRLKFKGTTRSFEALGKLLGFDDVRMVPLWGRVSPRLPNDPGSGVNDPDFSEVPAFWPQQDLNPFYDPHEQRDGPFFAWFGTVSNGTAATNYYPQVVNGFQPWVKFEADTTAIQSGTLTPATAGTYLLAGGAPHFKAYAALPSTGTFTALGEGESWNGVEVRVSEFGGTLRRLDINDRLSAIKYRTSFYNLGITMDADKADVLFGTFAARSNKDLAEAPHALLSYSGTLFGTSPYRPFAGGTAAFHSTTGIDTVDFVVPFQGTVNYYVERYEATLADAQQNYNELASAAQGVTQAMEEVRAATRQPRRASYGYLQDDTVLYAPIVAEECVLNSYPSTITTTQGTFTDDPLPPYRTGMTLYLNGEAYPTEDSTDSRWPERIFHRVTGGSGTLAGFTVPSAGSYYVSLQNDSAFQGTVCVDFYGTIGQANYPDTYEVVRADAPGGTQVFAAIADYGLAANFGGTNPAQRVANRVHSWNPEIIISLGDQNYYAGSPSTIHANNQGYWADIQQGRVFPALGNHDLDTDTGATQVTYFFNGTVPGNGRYYNVRRGLVEFFCLNPGWRSADVGGATGNAYYAPTVEPDGNTFDSIQGQWLREALRRSTAKWKVVYLHYPPYASSTATNNYAPGYPRMRWPFQEWGATIVLSGHVHAYERVDVDGFPYIIMGISGENNRLYDNVYITPGSQVRYALTPGPTNYGAIRIVATSEFLRFEALNANAALPPIDIFQINAADRRYLERPEDELDDTLVYETADEYPYRRDILGGGELIEADFYSTPGTAVEEYSILEQTMAVKDQTQADYDVYVSKGSFPVPQFVSRPKQSNQPGQRAIAFRGQFRDQASLGPDDLDLVKTAGGRTDYFHSELDNVFQPAYQLFHAGLVTGVLVADPDKFNGPHHLDGLRGWLPFNEHPEAMLAVRDAAMTLAVQSLTGVAPQDRQWDSVQGFSLRLMPGAVVTSSAVRDCLDEFTMACWIKLDGAFAGERLIGFGNFYVTASGGNLTLNSVDVNGVVQQVGPVAASGWTFIYASKTANQLRLASGNLSSLSAASTASLTDALLPNTGVDILQVNGASQLYQIRDLRIWNKAKTHADMDAVRYHAPVNTVVTYRVGHVLSLNSGDRYGLQVLANGWLAPANMPAWVRTPKFAKVMRYEGHGEFVGEPYRKEVGLGGGQIPPTPWKLGEQFFSMTANGTVAVAPQLGALPGSNVFWQGDATGAPGSYIVLSGSVGEGSLAVVTASGSGASPWPNRMEATNPVVESIWLPDDDGHVYQVKLKAGVGGAEFVAIPGTISNQEQGDARAWLARSGPGYYLGVTGYGSVVQKSYSGTVDTPPLFMYLNETLLEEVGGSLTLQRWTDPSSYGLSVGAPALRENGEIAFTNTATLRAGTYKLKVDLGNLGRVDEDFDGFRLDVTVADTTYSYTLLQGFDGNNFRGQQEVTFEFDHDVVGDWILTFDWLNAYSDPTRGVARQLAIYGYELRRLETNLFSVTLAGAGTTPVLTQLSYDDPYQTVPGGWLLGLNSYGTVVIQAHEGTVYQENDTTRSRYPLANTLTGVTAERREDVLANGTWCLGDTTPPAVILL